MCSAMDARGTDSAFVAREAPASGQRICDVIVEVLSVGTVQHMWIPRVHLRIGVVPCWACSQHDTES